MPQRFVPGAGVICPTLRSSAMPRDLPALKRARARRSVMAEALRLRVWRLR